MGKKRTRRVVIQLPPTPRLIRRWRREGVTEQRFRSFAPGLRRRLLRFWREVGWACPHGLPGPWCRRCGYPTNRQTVRMFRARLESSWWRVASTGRPLTAAEHRAWDRAALTEQRIVTEARAARRGGRYEP